MKNLLLITIFLMSAICSQAQWNPEITVTGYGTTQTINGYPVSNISAKFDFTPLAGATGYGLRFCPQRLTNAATVDAINNHYPACGASFTANHPTNSIFISLWDKLMPGENYVAYLVAFTATSVTTSPVFTFKSNGENCCNFCQVLGCMEYCRNDGVVSPSSSAPAPTKVVVKKNGR